MSSFDDFCCCCCCWSGYLASRFASRQRRRWSYHLRSRVQTSRSEVFSGVVVETFCRSHDPMAAMLLSTLFRFDNDSTYVRYCSLHLCMYLLFCCCLHYCTELLFNLSKYIVWMQYSNFCSGNSFSLCHSIANILYYIGAFYFDHCTPK